MEKQLQTMSSSDNAAEIPLGVDVLGDLPMDALVLAASFLNKADQLKMTLMRKLTLAAVEQACEKELQQLIKDHAVDTTFNARIRNQENIETARTKPVVLPWRYLLWAAQRTHLYKIAIEERMSPLALNISPSESRVAIPLWHAVVLLELATKRRLATLSQ